MKHKYPQFEGMSDMDVIFMIREVKALDAPEDAQWLREAEDELKFRASRADVSHATHIRVKLPEVITSYDEGGFIRMRINWGNHSQDLTWSENVHQLRVEEIGEMLTKALHYLQEKNPPVQTNS